MPQLGSCPVGVQEPSSGVFPEEMQLRGWSRSHRVLCQRDFVEDVREGRHRQQCWHQPGSPGGVAKKLEEERKWRSKHPTKPKRQDFKL